MTIEIGQDGTGLWAWVIKDARGKIAASHDGYLYTEEALSVAMAKARDMRVTIDNIRIHRPAS